MAFKNERVSRGTAPVTPRKNQQNMQRHFFSLGLLLTEEIVHMKAWWIRKDTVYRSKTNLPSAPPPLYCGGSLGKSAGLRLIILSLLINLF